MDVCLWTHKIDIPNNDGTVIPLLFSLTFFHYPTKASNISSPCIYTSLIFPHHFLFFHPSGNDSTPSCRVAIHGKIVSLVFQWKLFTAETSLPESEGSQESFSKLTFSVSPLRMIPQFFGANLVLLNQLIHSENWACILIKVMLRRGVYSQ